MTSFRAPARPRVFGGRRSGACRAGERLPLAALRSRLDDDVGRLDWLLHPDGVLGRALLMPAGRDLHRAR